MKKVTFGGIEVHEMHESDDHREARRGEWEQAARDRERFHMRIQRLSEIINPVFVWKYSEYVTNRLKKLYID